MDRKTRMQTGPQGWLAVLALLLAAPWCVLAGGSAGTPRNVENSRLAMNLGAHALWPGGSSGLDLDGSLLQTGELVLLGPGAVLEGHQEFGDRITNYTSADVEAWATRNAGTMIAVGVDENAHGIAPQAPLAVRRYFEPRHLEAPMLAGGLVGAVVRLPVPGWEYGSVEGEEGWIWHGDPTISPVEDYAFGRYDRRARKLDSLAHAWPDFLPVLMAGNERLRGPDPGTGHWVMSDTGWVWSEAVRNLDGGPEGWDCIAYEATAKNALTLGANHLITGGYSNPGDVSGAAFSGAGPVDDGRIKPDLVAPGVLIYTTDSASPNSYATVTGTSVSTSAAAGALGLLAQQYRSAHADQVPRAATLRAVAIHTANEAGQHVGPDYRFGWGLLDALAAAELIEADFVQGNRIHERTLAGGGSDTLYATSEGGILRATLAWTDPPADTGAVALDDTSLRLVNDLDLRLVHLETGYVFNPFVLNPGMPSNGPTRGDNDRDNVEMVHLANAEDGQWAVVVEHEGSLSGAEQEYSLALTGLEPPPPNQLPLPRNLHAQLNPAVGTVGLSWSHDGSFPPNLERLTYDDGDPDETASIVGSVLATHFSPAEACEVEEVHIWTGATREGLSFDVFTYDWLGGSPGAGDTWNATAEAVQGGWTIYEFPEGALRPAGDFVAGMRTMTPSVSIGRDGEDNGRSWTRVGENWHPEQATWFIRAVVRYTDGTRAVLQPRRSAQRGARELDELEYFEIWRSGEVVGTSDSLTWPDQLPGLGSYVYRIIAIYTEGRSLPSEAVRVDWPTVSVPEEASSGSSPRRWRIRSASPNPFNAAVTVRVEVPARGRARLEVFDLLGRRVALLHEGPLAPGEHRYRWSPEGRASGVYLVRFAGRGVQSVRKVLYLR